MENPTDFFKILGDETRLRILHLLSKREHCVCELTEILGLSQPNISKHLTKLKDLGFVETKRDAQFIYYNLNIKNQFHQDILNLVVSYADQNHILKEDAKKTASCALQIKTQL